MQLPKVLLQVTAVPRFVRQCLSVLLKTVLVLGIGLSGVLGSLFLWFRPPFAFLPREALVAAFALVALACLFALFTRKRRVALILYGLAYAGLVFWWNAIVPLNDRDWEPSVARMPTGQLEGDWLTVNNVRHFEWRNVDKAEPERWETRRYDLNSLRSVDLVINYWMGPHIAHPQVSFGFADGSFLIWSIEVRNLRGQSFDALSGLFQTNELVFVAGDERDIVRRRTNFTNEDVYVYRIAIGKERAREFLVEYVSDANRLAEKPRFYNTLTTNCTSVIFKLAQAIGLAIPFDWRLVLTGHLPAFLFDFGALTKGYSLEQLKQAAAVSARAAKLPDSPAFSQQIREGIPGISP